MLEENDICVPFSCREGLCRTCETTLCAGKADHRDYVLSDAEREAQASMMVCVSRARTPVLELDL
jgi:tetrachlorobenzoquinone reductase